MPKVQMTTLGYIEKEDAYLMLHRVKKEQDVNEGKWIGIGGKFEYGESPEDCMKRETEEETGLTVTSMKFRGILTFICDKQDPEYICLYTIDGLSQKLFLRSFPVLQQVLLRSLSVSHGWKSFQPLILCILLM